MSKSGDVSPAGYAPAPTAHQHQDPSAYPIPPSYPTNMEPAVPESLQQQQLDLSLLAPLAQAPAPIINPTVSSVSITRRDPRMARHSAAVTVTYPPPEKPINNSAEPLPAPIGALVDVAPKAPLPMPPAPPSAAKTRCSISPHCHELTLQTKIA